MGTKPVHTRLLTEAVRVHLRPLGMVQRGRSRVWLDDRGWCVTVVEFQPSDWSRGTYLNVGAHFLWTWSGHLSFDFGDRVEGFVAYESDAQFAPAADRFAARAAAEVLALRESLPTPGAVARIFDRPCNDGWPTYHKAVSLGLSGQAEAAADTFRQVTSSRADDDRAWVVELRRRCSDFAELVPDRSAFFAEIGSLIAAQRAALKLPGVQDVLPS